MIQNDDAAGREPHFDVARDPALEVSHIRVEYGGGAVGVFDVSLHVYAGEVVGLLGANGAGKTTTARAATGFMRSENARVVKGYVRVLGKDVTNAEPATVAQLGAVFVPERRKVFPSLSVDENLLLVQPGRLLRKRRDVERARARAFDLFPVLAGRSRELAGRLSGGQQQMLAIARALAANAKLLIVDEATLGLHVDVHAQIFLAVQRIAEQGSAVVLVDDSSTDAQSYVDRHYVLDSGSMVAATQSDSSDRDEGREGEQRGYPIG